MEIKRKKKKQMYKKNDIKSIKQYIYKHIIKNGFD